YVDLLMQAPASRRVEAFETSERARARTLVEALDSPRSPLDRDLPAAQVAARDTARRNVRADELRYRVLLDHGPSTAELRAAEAKLSGSLETYRSVAARLDAESSRAVSWTGAQPLTLPALQRSLPADAVLLEYQLGDERSYLWSVGRGSFASFT